MASVALLATSPHRPPASPPTPPNAANIAMTMRATIRPYSMAVAPRSSRSSRMTIRLPCIGFPPEMYGPMQGFSQQAANEALMRSVNVENSPTLVLVVAAAIFDGEGRLLLQQALPGKRHAGEWEFPGGKVE